MEIVFTTKCQLIWNFIYILMTKSFLYIKFNCLNGFIFVIIVASE
jgi:hypothetical protein